MENIQTTPQSDALMDQLLGMNAQHIPADPVQDEPVIAAQTQLPTTQETAPLQEEKAQEPVVTEASKPIDPLEAYLGGNTEQEPAWPQEALERFKTELGFETPSALKQHLATLTEQGDLLKTKAAEADALKQAIDDFPYELQQAITRQLEGQDGVEYIRTQRAGVSLAKEAKEIDKFKLVEARFPGKFSAEQIEAIKEGDTVLGAAHDRFHELASMEHDGDRAKDITRAQAKQKANSLRTEVIAASQSAAIATFKQNKTLAALVDNAFVEKFRTGQLEREFFYNDDGTYKPEALARFAQISVHDKLVERARAGARTEGKNDALAEAHARLPQTPAARNSERIAAPQLTEDQVLHQSIQSVLFNPAR